MKLVSVFVPIYVVIHMVLSADNDKIHACMQGIILQMDVQYLTALVMSHTN